MLSNIGFKWCFYYQLNIIVLGYNHALDDLH